MVEKMEAASATSDSAAMDEFYIGYLKSPPGYVRFLKVTVPLLLLCSIAASGFLIRSHADPGNGVWNDATLQHFEGVIDTKPYPMLRITDEQTGKTVQTLLLVAEGKFGARQCAEQHDGQVVRVSGTVLERDGSRLLELADGETSIQGTSMSEASERLRRPISQALGRRTLRGEIIDPKCYCGAMKPGEGKAHKECATLCISGGIPPMFISRNSSGVVEHYVLADSKGNAVGDGILPFVADPIELSGAVERLGDLLLLKIDPADIHRL